MSRVTRNKKRRTLSKADLRRLATIRARIHDDYGLIELGLQGIGPRRSAKMAVLPTWRP